MSIPIMVPYELPMTSANTAAVPAMMAKSVMNRPLIPKKAAGWSRDRQMRYPLTLCCLLSIRYMITSLISCIITNAMTNPPP